MGGGASKATKKDLKVVAENGLDADLVEQVAEALADKGEEAGGLTNESLKALLESISDPDDNDPDFAVLKIVRDEKVKVQTFSRKKKAKKAMKKAEKKGCSAVLVKGGAVHENKVCGDPRKVVFLIGMAFGKGWCDLGPLAEDDSEYQIFKDDDDDEDSDGEDEGDDDDDDDNFHIIKTKKDGSGISDWENPKKKKAMKKFKKLCNKGIECILVKKNKIIKCSSEDEGGSDEKRLTFIIGVAYGRGMIEDLGPLEDDGPMAILEDDFDAESSDDE